MTACDVLSLREKSVGQSPSSLLPGSSPHFAAIEGNEEPAQSHPDPLSVPSLDAVLQSATLFD